MCLGLFLAAVQYSRDILPLVKTTRILYSDLKLFKMNSSGFDFSVHQVMVVKQYAHWLTHYAKKTPEQHIAHHRIRELILQVLCDQDQWDLKHYSDKSPKLEYVARNSNA